MAEVLSDEDLFEGVSLNLVVASTLAKLSSRCREALKRYYLDGEDTPTVAAALDLTDLERTPDLVFTPSPAAES